METVDPERILHDMRACNYMWWWCSACNAYHPTADGCYGSTHL
jgi:hypothetical protein